MGRPFYGNADFLNAALALVAERGPSGVTVGAITAQLKAPTGSFYHRFASRDALLGELWLQTVLAFSEGLNAALEGATVFKAALHTPAWVREHMDEGRLLLLYHRDDFVDGKWPPELRQKVADHTYRSKLAVERFARQVFGIRRTRCVCPSVVCFGPGSGRGGAAVFAAGRAAAGTRGRTHYHNVSRNHR